MANNKFADLTRQRILDAAYKLFMEKGWEETTIQDIIDDIGDLTRGAFYHHFKSKDDVIDAITTRMFLENNPFDKVRSYKNLNGLQKMKKVYALHPTKGIQVSAISPAIFASPAFFYRQLQDCMQVLAPALEQLILEGNEDGSMQAKHPKQVAETVSVMTNIYLNPLQITTSREEYIEKIEYVADVLEGLGVPLMDATIQQIYIEAYDKMFHERTANS